MFDKTRAYVSDLALIEICSLHDHFTIYQSLVKTMDKDMEAGTGPVMTGASSYGLLKKLSRLRTVPESTL